MTYFDVQIGSNASAEKQKLQIVLTLIFLTLKIQKIQILQKNCVKNISVKNTKNIVLENFNAKKFKKYCV